MQKTIGEDGALFALDDGDYKITLSLPDAIVDTPVTVVNDGKSDEKFETKIEEISTLTKIISSVRFDGILPNTDAEYVLRGNDVKENLIINEHCENYIYTFELLLENLTATLAEDGSILLLAGEEIAYVFPAPYMYDAEGAYSDEVFYTLDEIDGGRYLLCVTPNEEWINEEGRAFPVTVDPTVVNLQYGRFIEDTFVISGTGANYSNNQNMRVGKVGANTVYTAYYSIGEFPDGMDLPLISAELNLKCMTFSYNGNDQVKMLLYPIDYIEDLTLVTGETTIDLPENCIETNLYDGDTSFSFDLLDKDFLLNTLGDRHVSYCLKMNDLYNTSVIVRSVESSYKPSLILGYGYCAPAGILSTNTTSPEHNYTLTNERLQSQPGCTMLVPGTGTSLVHMNYDPTYSPRKICFTTASSTAQTVKICYYGSGKYMCTVSSTAGSPVIADTYGDYDSWTLIWLNDGTLIIQSVSCVGMVLTRTAQGVCIDYLSNEQIENQIWRLAGTEDDGRTIDTGIYYVNNNVSKKFLVDNGLSASPSPVISSATEGEYEDRMAWMISYIGDAKYTIRSMENTDKFLYADSGGAGYAEYTAAPASKSLFSIDLSGNYYTLKSDAGYYLTCTNINVLGRSSTLINAAKWRICKNDNYQEYQQPAVVDYQLLLGEQNNFQIADYYSSHYTYSSVSSEFDSFTITTGSDFSITHVTGSTYSVMSDPDGVPHADIINIATVRHIPTGKVVSLGRVWIGNAIWCFSNLFDDSTNCLKAYGDTTIKVETAVGTPQDAGFGSQLWYTEYDSIAQCYYIHSLHVINHGGANNYGVDDDNRVLTIVSYNADNKTAKLQLTNKGNPSYENAQKWQFVSIGNGEYSICNMGYQDQKINSVDNNGIAYTSEDGTLVWTMVPANTLNLPDCTWDGGYNDNDTIHHIKIEISSNITNTPSVLNSLLSSSNYSNLFGVWNGITNNIVIHYPDDQMVGITNYFTAIFDIGTVPEGIAQTRGNNGDNTANEDWYNCHIIINEEYINDAENTLALSIKHELGHMLKLSHTFGEGNYHSTTYLDSLGDSRGDMSINNVPYEDEVLSIMNYLDPRTDPYWQTKVPSFLDKYNLIRKWGV